MHRNQIGIMESLRMFPFPTKFLEYFLGPGKKTKIKRKRKKGGKKKP